MLRCTMLVAWALAAALLYSPLVGYKGARAVELSVRLNYLVAAAAMAFLAAVLLGLF